MSEDRLELARRRFLDSLPRRFGLIRDGAAAYLGNPPDREHIEAGSLAAHSLAGAAAMFGRPDIGDLARVVEDVFAEICGSPVGPTDDLLNRLRDAVEILREAIESPLEEKGSPGTQGGNDAPRLPADPAGRRLLLIEDDADLAAELTRQLSAFDWEVTAVADASSAVALLAEDGFRLVVADIMLPEGPLAGTALARQLPSGTALPPIVFLSARWDWEARLAAVRANAAAYLAKPVDISLLADTLDRLVSGGVPRGGRILLVDDDNDLAAHYVALLEGAGHRVLHLDDPSRLLSAIPEFVPELIVMDLHMPGCSGLDVARVLRQDETNTTIPILFLSADTRRGPAQAAIIAGADDFLLKPIGDDWLVSAINARILRARAMNSLALRDSMTGLLNHLAITQQLEREVAATARDKAPLSLAMIDIDHFKLVNDTYGHPVGDKVIRGLAQLLKQRLRRSDAIGRYGGEEFVIVLRDTDLAAAHRLVDDIRVRFSGLRFHGGTTHFQSTLSAGVCQVQAGESAGSAMQRADEALYVAKRAGRNRVINAQ